MHNFVLYLLLSPPTMNESSDYENMTSKAVLVQIEVSDWRRALSEHGPTAVRLLNEKAYHTPVKI